MRRVYGRERVGHSHENSMNSQVKNYDLSKLRRLIYQEDTTIRLEIRALSDKDMLRVLKGLSPKWEGQFL